MAARKKSTPVSSAGDEFKQIDRIKAEFTSMISHELSTPLSAIKAGIDLTLDGIVGPITSDQRDTLTVVKANVDRLSRMIHNVLNFTRLEAGVLHISLEKTNLTTLIADVYKIMALVAKKKNITFTLNLPPHPVIAMCDSDKVKQVLINLIDNAIKFTAIGGNIDCGMQTTDGHVHLWVEDDGIGIKPEEHAIVFELYRQTAELRAARGVGVGLTLCKKIIESHHGHIELSSDYGKGSRFIVILPLPM